MPRFLISLTLLLGWLAGAPAARAQAPATASAVLLRLGGRVATPRQLTAADLARLPRRTLSAPDRAGQPHQYQGWSLADVLGLAGAPAGKAIHGPVLAQVLLARGADGYHVALALPEVDSTFSRQRVLVADRRDGQPLPPDAGPLQLVVPGDRRPARWVRQLTALDVVAVE